MSPFSSVPCKAAAMAMWHYAIGSQTYGPVSDEVIRSLATQGVLGPMASILPQGSASWTPVHVHEMTLGLRRTAAGGYVLLGPPATAYDGPRTPMPPPPPVFYPTMPPAYQQIGRPGGPAGPNGMEFAGWWERVGAALLDFLVLIVPNVVIVLLVVQPEFVSVDSTYKLETDTGRAIIGQLLVLAIGVVYFGLMHSSQSGQTLGKRALGIRVVSVAGARLSRWRAVLRYIVSAGLVSLFALLLPFISLLQLLDVLWPLWDDRNQALHDKAAGSLVVRA